VECNTQLPLISKYEERELIGFPLLNFFPEQDKIKMLRLRQEVLQKGIVRGLHFQAPPFAQGKLVRVIQGAVMDVAVDIRKNSPTYGQHFTLELSAENRTMFFIPPGFAHGFETLIDNTIFLYKCTDVYNKESEGGLLWNDADLGIKWNSSDPLISDKDKILPRIKEFTSPY
jgi:dTDP-4-dehydrorhamnose 3,5-epimerase